MEKVPEHRAIVNAIIDFGRTPADSTGYRTRQLELLQLVDADIARGASGMRVCKALLESCSDWSTCEIDDPEGFKARLLDAVEHGALAPDNIVGWDWLEIAADNNDPSEFMDDTLRFYDLLADAGEHGISGAFDIINCIWEPENCQEED